MSILLGGYSSICMSAGAEKILITTSSITSSYYACSSGIAAVVNKYVPELELSATPSGGSVDNMQRLGRKEAELAIGMPDIFCYAVKGEKMFEGNPVKAMSLFTTWSNPLNIIVTKKSNINSISELKGKKIATGARGTGTTEAVFRVLEVYGISQDEITWSHLPASEQAIALKDGVVDAIMMTMGPPNAAYADLAMSQPVKWLAVDDDKLKAVVKQSPFYSSGKLDAGMYPGQDKDIKTLTFRVHFVARADLDQEIVYKIVKIIFEHLDEIGKYHAVAKKISLETALDGLSKPMHPGAEKYFREVGLIE